MATIEKRTEYAANGQLAKAPADAYYADESRGVGWVFFAATMLGLAGIWGLVDGILAISSSKVFTANATYVFSDLHTWGWIVTILGAFAIVASFALLTGSELARWFGIVVAGFNALGQLMFVHANPWWSMAMFAVDILVIYGLAMYAGARLRDQ
jgi:hypothetical protein